MDAKYASMTAAGKPFDPNAIERDHYTVFGEFDRRTLNAVANNIGGQFSTVERDMAFAIMDQQYKLGIGLQSGPKVENPQTWDVLKDNISARLAFANQWLDQVSAEEKTSPIWAFEKAYTEVAYEQSELGDQRLAREAVVISVGAPEAPNLVDASENPLVKLIKAAIYEPRERATSTTIRNLEDLKSQEWMANYRDRVDEAYTETVGMYLKTPY